MQNFVTILYFYPYMGILLFMVRSHFMSLLHKSARWKHWIQCFLVPMPSLLCSTKSCSQLHAQLCSSFAPFLASDIPEVIFTWHENWFKWRKKSNPVGWLFIYIVSNDWADWIFWKYGIDLQRKENPGNQVHFPSLAQTSCAALGTNFSLSRFYGFLEVKDI